MASQWHLQCAVVYQLHDTPTRRQRRVPRTSGSMPRSMPKTRTGGSSMSTIRSIYADGGVIDRNPSSIGGTWAYCHVDDDDNRISEQGGIFIPSPRGLVTNNRMEFLALLSALEALPSGWSGRVCSDSRVTLGRLFHSWKMT